MPAFSIGDLVQVPSKKRLISTIEGKPDIDFDIFLLGNVVDVLEGQILNERKEYNQFLLIKLIDHFEKDALNHFLDIFEGYHYVNRFNDSLIIIDSGKIKKIRGE